MKRRNIVSVVTVLAAVLSLPMEAAIRSDGERPGFQIRTSGPRGWIDQGSLRFGMNFEEKSLPISLKESLRHDGRYAVRIRSSAIGVANVDSVFLEVGGRRIKPIAARRLRSGEDLLRKLAGKDLDVINAQGSEVEVVFAAPKGLPKNMSDARLVVTGREEDPDDIPGGPCGYPSALHPSPDMAPIYHYALGSRIGSIRVDGRFTSEDRMGGPFFKSWTRPISGHPEGFTYGYVKNDDRYLYGAIDFTSDNTYDGIKDFGAILVETPKGWRRFEVSVDREEWGRHGFIYTDKVAYQHKVYEFRIPLAELGVKRGDRLAMRFEAYGTAACPPPSGTTLSLGIQNPALGTVILGTSTLERVMLQIRMVNSEQAVEVQNIRITGSGTGNEASDIEAVRLYLDNNSDGAVDGGDTQLGTGTFGADNGTVQLTASPTVSVGGTKNVLIVYRIKSTAAGGATFKATLAANGDVTQDPGSGCQTPNFTGAPLGGNTLTVSFGSTAGAQGANAPSDGDVAPGQSNVPMMQFSLTAGSAESQGLNSVRVTASGDGDDSSSVSAVRLWEDADGDGSVSAGDTELATAQTFSADDGAATFGLSPVGALAAGQTKNYLVTYDFASTSASLSLDSFKRLASRIRIRPIFLFPWLFPWATPMVLSGCGGSGEDGESETAVVLSGAPAGTQFTDEEGNPITGAESGTTVQLRTTDGLPILEFTAGDSDVSLDGAVVGRDGDETLVALGTPDGASLAVDGVKAAVSGLPDTITVFVPCDGDDNRVRVCPQPQDTELSDGLASCDGEIRLSSGTPSASGITWDNTDRTGTADCEVSGAPSAFNEFVGQGVTETTFQTTLSSSADVTLTGVSSGRTINPSGLPVSGALKQLVAP